MKTKKQLIDFEHKGNEKHHFKLRPALLSLCMLTFIGGYSQTGQVNLNLKNASVKELFREIEKQTSYRFSYRDAEVNNKGGINISGQGKELKEVLTNELAKQQLSYTVSGYKIIVSPAKNEAVSTKEKKVTGKVVDTKGEPVIGATIMEKGTNNGTITDFDGNFTLDISAGAVLQFSYIGYANQDVKVGNSSNLSITMKEDTETLDEVVVVGYGTAKKSDLAGAVVRADLSTLQESPSVSLGEALQGTIPGLNVGAVSQAGKDPDMSIRGRTSISGSNSPLIVLDGIIFRGNLVDINMSDVESVDVLKDASAAAIYGSEASNGVILITSKQGRTEKPVIEYSGAFSFQSPTNNNMIPENRDGFLRKIADTFLEESRIGDDMLQMNPNWDVTKHFADNNALNGYLNGVDTDWWNLLTVDRPYIQNHNLSVR